MENGMIEFGGSEDVEMGVMEVGVWRCGGRKWV